MDLVIGLVGGVVLTYVAKMVVKNMIAAAVIGLVVTLVVLGFLSSGINISNGLATVVGVLIGYVLAGKMMAK